jgi:hypothetical protein
MDPFTVMATRVLHAERVAEAAQRRRWSGAQALTSGPQGSKPFAWLRALPIWPLRRHAHEKATA